MIEPTKCRMVLFTPSIHDRSFNRIGSEPLAALVVHVHSERRVNLVVFDSIGSAHARTEVPLLQLGDQKHEAGFYCEWPERTAMQTENRRLLGRGEATMDV